MQDPFNDWLRSFFPVPLSVGPKEWLRAVIGVGLVVLPMVSVGLWLFGGPVTLHIVAPAGASAVILFSASSSPFAQPWSVLGGNLIAVTIGVALGTSALPTVAAAVLAVCLAIACLFLLRCMHPPSCALAMVAAIGGPGISELGYGLLIPVAFNSLLLIAAALVYNNLTRHPYPKPRAASGGEQSGSVPLGEEHMSFTSDDVDRALQDFGEYVDVTRDDLVAFHDKWFHPNNVMLAVWGDFDADEIERKMSVIASVGWGEWRKKKINFITTPGDVPLMLPSRM